MSIPPNTTQRDLVRLALLMCGDRAGEKYRPPVKGTASSDISDSSLRYPR